jgi:hypothetical protein
VSVKEKKMACPICDQKPMNCDCTPEEKRQWLEIEELNDEIASRRLTDAERDAIRFALGRLSGTLRGNEECDHYDTLSGLLVRFK